MNDQSDDKNFGDFIEWSERLETGFRAIDQDHQALIEIIENLRISYLNKPNDDFSSFEFTSLVDRMEEHFRLEEDFMNRANYPKLDEHRQEHIEYSNLLNELRRLIANDPKRVDAYKVIDFLSNWFRSHILSSDMDYIPYLRGDIISEIEKPLPSANFKKEIRLSLNDQDAEIILQIADALDNNAMLADKIIDYISRQKAEHQRGYHIRAVKLFTK